MARIGSKNPSLQGQDEQWLEAAVKMARALICKINHRSIHESVRSLILGARRHYTIPQPTSHRAIRNTGALVVGTEEL